MSKLPGYPAHPQRFEVRPGLSMNYLDEGPRDGEVVVMVHGNPSWSYYWRTLVAGLSDRYRCIVPDHIGMGLSDKPDDSRYEYTLQSRVDDLDSLLKHLGITGPVTLAVHDWGGMIGFGWALSHHDQVKRLVVLNTAAFPMPAAKKMPWQIALGRHWKIGEWIIRSFNAFSSGASWLGVERKMPADVRRAYVSPYNSYANRISTIRFMQDIPLSPADKAWSLLERAGKALPSFADRPAFLGWGLRDFVFDHHFLKGFQAALPKAQVHAFEDAGHYVLEDKHEVLVPEIRAFLDKTPIGGACRPPVGTHTWKVWVGADRWSAHRIMRRPAPAAAKTGCCRCRPDDRHHCRRHRANASRPASVDPGHRRCAPCRTAGWLCRTPTMHPPHGTRWAGWGGWCSVNTRRSEHPAPRSALAWNGCHACTGDAGPALR
jgi:haloalkane dehalogenase